MRVLQDSFEYILALETEKDCMVVKCFNLDSAVGAVARVINRQIPTINRSQ